MTRKQKKRIRNIIIKTWAVIGLVLAFVGFLYFISIEDSTKYFGQELFSLRTLMILIISVAAMLIGGNMFKEAIEEIE